MAIPILREAFTCYTKLKRIIKKTKKTIKRLTFVVPSLKKSSVIVTLIFSLFLDKTYPGANVIVMLS